MSNSEPLLSPTLVIVCVVMVLAAGLVSRYLLRGPLFAVPGAGARAAIQLAAVATVLGAASAGPSSDEWPLMTRLWPRSV